ncbi:SpoIIE family protein phosphatase [Nonomuraea sp. K274]|uniref:SpoIIE family protein phosphatase n=1 Tax=Nonomuraea cypriaca TaxID=1187855 RepID=A0A931F2V8_9ACTN|nr:PP2C family protein-serine/threonine phosphatase [Nonomuraea cypriaca]MBF8189501.1 SpoIIE family protein phosphatase [Nonomuraea cypriaca]
MVDVIGAAELLGPESDEEMLAVRLAHAQRLGNMGWAEWHHHTGETVWSDQVYTIFGRDPAAGPIPLPELAGHVDPSDVGALDRLLRTATRGLEPVQAEFRIRRGVGAGELRDLRVVLAPLMASGDPVGLHGVIQDITGRRRAERMVCESRRQLLEAREQAAEERHVMLALREAILPEPAGRPVLPHTTIAVRYVPAEKTANLGGDWFEAAPSPDGRLLLAIGDVSGHGLPAIAHMAQLRHALVGLTMTGRPANQLLAWLNELVAHQFKDVTATAIIGHLDPETRVLAWSQAGNLAPILVRDGVATQLAQPRGVLLGAAAGRPYELATTRLLPGDVLLMFTDGLVERRTRDIDAGLDLALAAARDVPGPDLDAGLDRLLAGIGGPNPEDDACLLAVAIPTQGPVQGDA